MDFKSTFFLLANPAKRAKASKTRRKRRASKRAAEKVNYHWRHPIRAAFAAPTLVYRQGSLVRFVCVLLGRPGVFNSGQRGFALLIPCRVVYFVCPKTVNQIVPSISSTNEIKFKLIFRVAFILFKF